VLPNRQKLAEAYPSLAARQDHSIQSVIALALLDLERPLGGLLLYLDHEVGSSGPGVPGHDLKERVVRALRRVRTAESSQDRLPPGHRLPADETAPALARQLLRGTLGKQGVAEHGVDSALLCASEIVTNVVMHTARPSVLTIEASGQEVTVQIRHPTAATEPPIEPPDPVDALDIAGRGLALVDAVADAWGVEHEPEHTCWWFRIA
jgi:anti-sigma regulatory factor (Ser/Thr protein kinase)